MAEQANLTQQTTVKDTCQLRVWDGKTWHELTVSKGSNLRSILLERGLSPHNFITQYFNCQGNGFCGSCAVKIEGNAPQPSQWLDRIAAQFGDRLSCQISVEEDMTIKIS
ncbi:MAG: 2Fe-2S iron-sulfur cluster-binding protein [Prochloraceae cyanobacterium]